MARLDNVNSQFTLFFRHASRTTPRTPYQCTIVAEEVKTADLLGPSKWVRCGMCIIPGQVNPYFPAICGWFLCVPYAFLHFRSSGVCVRVQDIQKSTAGIPEIIGPLSDLIRIRPAPPMSFPEVYLCVFTLFHLLFTWLDIIPLVIRFGPELPSIALFFLTFP